MFMDWWLEFKNKNKRNHYSNLFEMKTTVDVYPSWCIVYVPQITPWYPGKRKYIEVEDSCRFVLRLGRNGQDLTVILPAGGRSPEFLWYPLWDLANSELASPSPPTSVCRTPEEKEGRKRMVLPTILLPFSLHNQFLLYREWTHTTGTPKKARWNL